MVDYRPIRTPLDTRAMRRLKPNAVLARLCDDFWPALRSMYESRPNFRFAGFTIFDDDDLGKRLGLVVDDEDLRPVYQVFHQDYYDDPAILVERVKRELGVDDDIIRFVREGDKETPCTRSIPPALGIWRTRSSSD